MSKRQLFPAESYARHACACLLIATFLLIARRSEADGGNFDAPAPASQPASQPAAPTAEILKKYDSLYGSEEHHAARAGGREQAKFAQKLLDATKKLKDDPDLVSYMLGKSYTFGLKDPSGYETATDAINALDDLHAAPAQNTTSRRADLYRLMFRHASGAQRTKIGLLLTESLMQAGTSLAASGKFNEALKVYSEAQSTALASHSARGDEIAGDLRSVHARMRVKEKLDKLLEKLHEKPEAFVAAEAAKIYLTGLDMPGEVAKLPGIDTNSDLARIAALAAGDPMSLSEADCMTLGDWYAAIDAGGDENMRLIVLDRAQIYYSRLLELHAREDADHLKATEALAKISKQLDQMSPHARTADRIVVWNTHNAKAADRGTTRFNLYLLRHGEIVWSQVGIPIEWKPNAPSSVVIPAPRAIFDAIRIEITAWHGHGGGLAEVEVWRGAENIALGGTVAADYTYQPGAGPPSNLTDGITDTPAEYYHGYWLALDGKPAKVDITLPNGTRRPIARQ